MPPETQPAPAQKGHTPDGTPGRKKSSASGLKNSLRKTLKPKTTVDVTQRPIALVGLMGVGKTTVGRRLSKALDLPFYDSDEEIELASGRTVAGYFRDHGESAFRDGERRVIERLLSGTPMVLSTGGGAFIPEDTRAILQNGALTIFLKGEFETIMRRVRKKDTRPLLQVADPRAALKELMDHRYPIYAQADITVKIAKGPHNRTVNKVIRAIEQYYVEAKQEHPGTKKDGTS